MQHNISASPRTLARAATVTALVACFASIASCGAGTAAAISGGGGGSSGGNTPPAMSGFSVLDPKVPAQTRVRFVLADEEGDPAEVELFYQAPGRPALPLTQAGPNPAMLATSSQGVEHVIAWNFAAEPDLPDDARFIDGIAVFARIHGGIQEIVPGANAANVGLGNDAPKILDIGVPAQESHGIIGIQCTALDSSSDVVSVRIEYDIQGDQPDAGWILARPALTDATPLFGVEHVVAQSSGTSISFFWDTEVDLADGDHDVKLRFTALDPVVAGDAVVSAAFRVDNNAEPIVTMSDALLLLEPDQHRGIPLPYIVRDEESDPIELIFQWKRPDESFPELPASADAIHALLADPGERRLHQVCTEFPTWVESRTEPIDSSSLRLPDLATASSSVLMRGLIGRELEIMRNAGLAAPAGASWIEHALDHPVAVLPIGDGIEALVLDRAGAGAWRLRKIELASGKVTGLLVSSAAGEPDAMTFEQRDQHSVLVASDVVGAWNVDRVTLADGDLTHLIGFDGAHASGAVRAIASTSRNSALITVGSSLLRLDYSDRSASKVSALFDDLATPWGLAVDPSNPQRVYLAEHDAPTQGSTPGRILVLDLDRAERHVLALDPADPLHSSVEAPRSLAFDPSRGHLLAVQAPGAPAPTIVQRIAIGSAHATITAASVPFAHDIGGIAGGPDGLITIALPSDDDLALSGGIEQRRRIVGFDRDHLTVRVDRDLRSAITPGIRSRVRAPAAAVRASPAGVRGRFVWDSTDVPHGGSVQFRAVVLDSERGLGATTAVPKVVRASLDADPLAMQDFNILRFPVAVAVADLDRDGDLDLVAANRSSDFGGGRLTVFFQTGPRVFGSPLTIDAGTFPGSSVAAGDLDGDGDIDLASASSIYYGQSLQIHFQISPGVFATPALVLGGLEVGDQPTFVALGDLDQDGDLDLVSANPGSGTLALYFQSSPGSFGTTPLKLALGGSGSNRPTFVLPVDIDGDMDIDLVTAGDESHTLAIFVQAAPGVFGPMPIGIGSAGSPQARKAIAADLDHDGDLDLASANFSTATVIYQTSPGEFANPPVVLEHPSGAAFAGTVAAVDYDDDGDLDLVVGSPPQGLTVFTQDADGTLEENPLIVRRSTLRPDAIVAADIDGDGHAEIIAASSSPSEITVSFQKRVGDFAGTPLLLSTTTPNDRAVDITAADLEGDGDLDIISAITGFNSIAIFFQSSPGVFRTSALSLHPAGADDRLGDVTAADLDGDGDLDLAAGVVGSATLNLFFQTSPGTFGAPVEVGTAKPFAPFSVAAADLDGDEDLDLLIATFNGLAIYFQTDAGVFANTPLVVAPASTSGYPNSVDAADLDGDGDLDLVAASAFENKLDIYLQTSAGVFAATPVTLGGPNLTPTPTSVIAADLDGDGDLEIVSANGGYNQGQITIFSQSSLGVFDPVPLTLGNPTVLNGPRSISAKDFDRDGDLDLVCGNNYRPNLSVFLQTSPGAYAATPLSLGGIGVTNNPGTLVADDLDGDGDPDIVTVGAPGHTLSVFWNSH